MFGITLPDIEELDDPDFEVMEENANAINAFLTLNDCSWQFSSMGDLIGLDFQSAKVIWDYAGISVSPEDFNGVMLFSTVVAAETNKMRNKK
jgi:hypothetical protein